VSEEVETGGPFLFARFSAGHLGVGAARAVAFSTYSQLVGKKLRALIFLLEEEEEEKAVTSLGLVLHHSLHLPMSVRWCHF